ncbi:MAG: response regulator [Candidatus Omnitrophota bacterium]
MAKRILIADDEPTVVMLAKEKLEEQGYVVETARHGREAWDIIQHAPVDLIVTDVIMPTMDGVDLYKEIKKVPRLASIPIVIITDNRIFRESFQTLGVEHFLPKPLDVAKLIRKVDYIFTCAEMNIKNKQCLVLGANADVNAEMVTVLQGQGCVVGSSLDPIEFISNALILTPRIVAIDVLLKGDVPSREVIKALKCFTRLGGMDILVFTQFAPEDIGSMQGIEELRQAKNDCIEAGASRYIGRFSKITFWDMVKDSL